MKNLYELLRKTQTEEEVKNIFAKFFNLKLDTKNKIDLYTPQILFEFKFNENIKNLHKLATCTAQSLYYIRRLKLSLNGEIRTPSNFICIVDKNFAAIFETNKFSKIFNLKSIDWDLAPSSPCKKLVANLEKSDYLKKAHVYDFSIDEDEKNFIEKIRYLLTAQIKLFAEKKIINENNFYPIFEYWQKLFGAAVENGRKASEYFITDIEEGKARILDDSIIFRLNSNDLVEKYVDIDEYNHFWSVYEKIYNPREIISIRQKMDRMTQIDLRRRTGEFFTPINFAQKAVDYISRVVGEKWYKNGNFRLWDMCAGTGNLEFALDEESLQYCYLSTLLEDDADYCKKIYPAATVFQYDYLNDDVQNFFGKEKNIFDGIKMPKKLLDDLNNPKLKWIIFINPPYAMPTPFHKKETSGYKEGVSATKIQNLMKEENLGEASREIYAQFLYRINLEFQNKNAWLGIFSTLKYINSELEQKLREKIFQYKFERGFTFSSQNFDGCKGEFPVGFLIWNLAEKISLDKQKISLDVFNSDVEKVAVKNITTENSKDFLNKWIKRPKVIKKFPPIKSGITIAYKTKNPRDRIAENFLASFLCSSNDFSNANYTAFFSGPSVSHSAYSITPENFEKSLITFAVRKLEKATWLNDRDQFMQPTKKLSREFICDCVIWSLFSPSNQTVSLRNVEYEGEIYRMKNNLFPFLLDELRTWKISNSDLRTQIFMKREDRFAALWIKDNFADFSAESKKLFYAGKELYRFFYEGAFKLIELKKFKIEDWDAGWYQIRMSLKDSGADFEKFSAAFKDLGKKILPQIYELGFLRDEVKYF